MKSWPYFDENFQLDLIRMRFYDPNIGTCPYCGVNEFPKVWLEPYCDKKLNWENFSVGLLLLQNDGLLLG